MAFLRVSVTTLACLVLGIDAVPRDGSVGSAPTLYACSNQQCVPSRQGAPLSVCEAACVPPPTQTIAQLAKSNPSLLFLDTLLESAGLAGALSGPGPFTVLAPTNGAFGTFDLNSLLGLRNRQTLRKVLGYHVIKGAFRPADLAGGLLLDTLEGDQLQAIVRGGVQLSGTYIGPPRTNPNDVTNTIKVSGRGAVGMVRATNGVVYTIPTVFLPPDTFPPRVPSPRGTFSGCTKKSCIFSAYTPRQPTTPSPFACCIQADAAPRMSPEIFDNPVAVAAYVQITQQLSNLVVGRGNMVNAPCPGPNYRPAPNATLQVDWSEGFGPWCRARCGCGGLLNPCKDVPDDPSTNTYCSLCGPKYNAPLEVQVLTVKGASIQAAQCVLPGGA
jgi:uncharacterized surface protein with fasciclin (FAS1) repeats